MIAGMRRFVLGALLLALAGCSSVEPVEVWTASWAVISTPVLVACTPYNALWDGGLSLIDPGFIDHGMTTPSWSYWWDAVRLKEKDWGIPLAILLHPVLTALQPVTDLLFAAGISHEGG